MKMRKWIIVLMSLALAFGLTSCGKQQETDKHAGKYILTDEKFSDGSGEISQEWTLILEKDGKGKSNRSNLDIDVEWSVEGDKLKLTEHFLGKIEWEGTIKDGVIYLNDSTIRVYVFTKEGQEPAKVPTDYFNK